MATGCHQLHLSNNKSLGDIDIPPRKLLGAYHHHHHQQQQINDSPTLVLLPEETLFNKFLPYNSGVDTDEDDDDDPYASDHFRMYEFKVRKCTRSRSHDWTDCPFAHPGEKARRRCPRRYNYLGTVCADFRRGNCSRGDLCEFAHGVFECWLHPARYRTEACKDGKNCQRKICFFAHTQRQLRVVPTETIPPVKKFTKDTCAHCRCHLDVHHTISPTSTLSIDLDSLSPPLSPPFSPARSGSGTGFSPISRFADRLSQGDHSFCMTHLGNNSSVHRDSMNHEVMSNQSINELVRSMEAMAVEENELPNMNSVWMNSCGGSGSGGDHNPQFDHLMIVTQTTPFTQTGDVRQNFVNESSVYGPDLGWVNDLLT